VDDHAVFRRIADDVTAATDGFEAVGEASSGSQALETVLRLSADLVPLDVRMRGLDRIAVARRILANRSDVVVFLAAFGPLTARPFVGASATARSVSAPSLSCSRTGSIKVRHLPRSEPDERSV
jgi:CheY-like chemotaxis protein